MHGLAVLREQTARFIAERPTDVSLTRRTKVADGAGGYTFETSPVPPVTVRMVSQRRAVSTERRTAGGEMDSPDVVMIAAWDADVQRGDRYKDANDITMEVIWVTSLDYETVVEVAAR